MESVKFNFFKSFQTEVKWLKSLSQLQSLENDFPSCSADPYNTSPPPSSALINSGQKNGKVAGDVPEITTAVGSSHKFLKDFIRKQIIVTLSLQ